LLIPDPDPTIAPSRIPDPGGKKAPDPDPQHWFLFSSFFKSKYAMMFVKSSEGLPGSSEQSCKEEEEEPEDEEGMVGVEGPKENGALHGPANRPGTPGTGTI
jgi:hypothetical protein